MRCEAADTRSRDTDETDIPAGEGQASEEGELKVVGPGTTLVRMPDGSWACVRCLGGLEYERGYKAGRRRGKGHRGGKQHP
jgi:hypothetical protein